VLMKDGLHEELKYYLRLFDSWVRLAKYL
jgi:hypothetical protein